MKDTEGKIVFTTSELRIRVWEAVIYSSPNMIISNSLA